MNNLNKYEIVDNIRGIAVMQAPVNLIGGSEALDLIKYVSDINPDIVKSFVIDISNVNLINSSGLGSLISLHRDLLQKNIKFYLLNPSSKIINLLKMTHLDKVFSIITDISEL